MSSISAHAILSFYVHGISDGPNPTIPLLYDKAAWVITLL